MKHIILLLSILLLINCKKEKKKEAVLLADREAPLGWVYLRIYSDSTFEFESRGFRKSNIYSGKANITNDSIFFHYNDSIPYAGDKAVYDKHRVAYANGKDNGHENLEIKLSKLSK